MSKKWRSYAENRPFFRGGWSTLALHTVNACATYGQRLRYMKNLKKYTNLKFKWTFLLLCDFYNLSAKVLVDIM